MWSVRTSRGAASAAARLAVAVVSISATQFGTEAFAQHDPFAIDGIVTRDDEASDVHHAEAPSGPDQELGVARSPATRVGSIHADAPPTLGPSDPGDKADLRGFWIETRRDLRNNDEWLYFAWERRSKRGQGFISIEFQKAPRSAECSRRAHTGELGGGPSGPAGSLIRTCQPWAGRSAGDFILLWNQNGTALSIFKRVFHGAGDTLALGPPVAVTSAVAAIDDTGRDAGLTGEAALNLTKDVFDGKACTTFSNIIPATLSGDADVEDYLDVVLAPFPPVSNCGTLVVKHLTEPADSGVPVPEFRYLLERASGEPIRYAPATSFVNGVLTGDHAWPKANTHSGLMAADNYRLVEDVPTDSPWEHASTFCVLTRPDGDAAAGLASGFAIEGGATTECTILNRLRQVSPASTRP